MRTYVFLTLLAVAFASEDKWRNCVDRLDEGHCLGKIPMWHFDTYTKVCYKFIYGGCGGNGNMFNSKEACEKYCLKDRQNCLDNPDRGHCSSNLVRWYYDLAKKDCVEFKYSGCGGNGNRYQYQSECLKHCTGELDSEACAMPAETGVCHGFFQRFYFDRITGTCKKFIYGGCGGNENNFGSIEECHDRCGNSMSSACLQEKITGPCKANVTRFFYNKDTGECEKFTYGGCLGNSNNFNSEEDCAAVCKV